MKRCKDCGQEKPLEDFSPWKAGKDGRYIYCRPCAAVRSRAYAAKNREDVNARKRERRANPEYRERERQLDRARYVEDPEKGRARSRRWRERHPEKVDAQSLNRQARTPEQKERRWTNDLLKRYGLTVEHFQALLTKQGGGCAICGRTEPNGPGKRWQIDHDHGCCPGVGSCGHCIRGLLCAKCNTAIGLLNDDPELFAAAVRYLKR